MALGAHRRGIFVYERQRTDLDVQIERELSARLAGVDRDHPRRRRRPRRPRPGSPRPRRRRRASSRSSTPTGRSPTPPPSSPPQTSRCSRPPSSTQLHRRRAIERRRRLADSTASRFGSSPTRTKDDGVRYTTIVAASLDGRETRRSTASRRILSSAARRAPARLTCAYRVATGGPAPGRGDAPRAAEISGTRRASGCPSRQSRDESPPRSDSQRDARPARGGVRTRAPLRRRRQP